MLRLPRFGVVAPTTVAEVVSALEQPGARLIAGGTDILPNLKHRLDRPELLVSLARVASLHHITRDDNNGHVRIGAAVTLSEVSEHPLIRRLFPSLAQAAGLVASPSIRNMGTIGGNINLDTRCRYVNQSDFWRSAIGGCLKSEGDVCHVVKGGRNCVAAMSSDCVPVLHTLGAFVTLHGPDGERRVLISEYYNNDGVQHINKAAGELVTELRVPVPTTPRRTHYVKWTVRKSIDFPLISVALRFDLDADHKDALILAVEVCVSVLASKPRAIRRTGKLVGMKLSDPRVADALSKLVQSQCKPLDNVPYEAEYRRKMLSVYTRRALAAMLA